MKFLYFFSPFFLVRTLFNHILANFEIKIFFWKKSLRYAMLRARIVLREYWFFFWTLCWIVYSCFTADSALNILFTCICKIITSSKAYEIVGFATISTRCSRLIWCELPLLGTPTPQLLLAAKVNECLSIGNKSQVSKKRNHSKGWFWTLTLQSNSVIMHH